MFSIAIRPPLLSTHRCVQVFLVLLYSGPARGVLGVHRTRARAQGAGKSSGFYIKFWYRTITP